MSNKRFCAECGVELTKESQKIYCSNTCAAASQKKRAFAEAEATGEFPASGKFQETNRHFARSWLEYKHGHMCSICGLSEWNGQPIPLVVDHIDGNPQNHKIDNFRLLCPNCDAQQKTYKSRNLVNGSYVKGARAERKAAEYDRKLERNGLTRSAPRKRSTGVCPICGKTFSKKRLKQVYCSKPCVHEALKQRHT